MYGSIPRNSNRSAGHGPARRSAGVRIARVAAIAALIVLTGCNAMSSPQEAGMEPAVKIDTSKPIRFSTHAFGAHCFGGTGCRVEYYDRVVRSRPEGEPNPPIPSSELARLISAPHIGIPNFPAPASVSWQSEDGANLHALVDIGQIFQDQLVRHNVPAQELPTWLYSEIEPEILVVVKDRTLEVFMRARMPTTVPIGAGSQGGVRKDLILAYSRTY